MNSVTNFDQAQLLVSVDPFVSLLIHLLEMLVILLLAVETGSGHYTSVDTADSVVTLLVEALWSSLNFADHSLEASLDVVKVAYTDCKGRELGMDLLKFL